MSTALFWALALLAAGCAHIPQRTLTPQPRRPDLAVHDAGPPAPVRGLTPCVLVRVVDGDSITCRDIGAVRLIGIDSPERSQQPFGPDATRALVSMVPPGATLQLELDVVARDRYDRLLAYVWLDNSMLNWQMVRLGWAVVLTVPPNVQFVNDFTVAQERARSELNGSLE